MKPIPRARLPRSLAELYRRYAFQGTIPTAGFYWDTAGEWAERANAIYEEVETCIKAGLMPKDLAAIERKEARKALVNWRDRGVGAMYQEADVVQHGADQAEFIRAKLRERCAAYKRLLASTPDDALRDAYWSARVPINRGKGAPAYYPSGDRLGALKLAGAAFSSRALAELKANTIAVAGGDLWCLTAYERIQGADPQKEVPAYRLDAGRIVPAGTRIGPKVRLINAAPFGLNVALTGTLGVLKYLQRRLDEQATGQFASARAYFFKTRAENVVASDFSRYDETISLETRDALLSEILSPMHQLITSRVTDAPWPGSMADEIYYEYGRMPLLIPPTNLEDGALLQSIIGRNRSGEKYTSWTATEVGLAYQHARADALGLNIRVVVQGDDAVIWSPNSQLADRWNSDEHTYGFAIKAEVEPIFLMRDIRTGRGLYARMLAGTLNREVTREPTTVAQAAAGALSRMAMLSPALAERYLNFIETTLGPKGRLTSVYVRMGSPIVDRLLADESTRIARRGGRNGALEQLGEWAVGNPDLAARLFPQTLAALQSSEPTLDRLKMAVADLSNGPV